jgi:hypothetical protein
MLFSGCADNQIGEINKRACGSLAVLYRGSFVSDGTIKWIDGKVLEKGILKRLLGEFYAMKNFVLNDN